MSQPSRVTQWGVTGWSIEFGALADDSTDETPLAGAYGFEKILDPGVIYRAQPDVPGVPRWHDKPETRGRVVQMGWPSTEPPLTESLLDLRDTIATRRRELATDDPQLGRLDDAIRQLVAIAELLRARRASIGFMQPDSVRIGTHHDGATYVQLPDVGFAWDDTGGLYEPEWLAKPQAELLFERGARVRNSEYLARLKQPIDEHDMRTQAALLAADEAEDVKIVVRLIALALAGRDEVARWCGAAKSLLRLPGKDVAPDTGAPIWDQVIAPALEGHVLTFAELRLRLAATKPSEHFLYSPPAPPWRGWAILRQTGGVVAAVALLFGLWTAKGRLFPPRVYAPYCRHVQEGDPLHAKLFELQDKETRSKVDESVRTEFRKLLDECLGLHAGLKACGGDCLREPAETSLDMAVSEGEAVLDRLRVRPGPVAAELPEIEAAIDSVTHAAKAANRDTETGVVKRLERQKDLRGGVVARPAVRAEK